MNRSISPTSVLRVASEGVHQAAPAFGWYTDHVLFHRIWSPPNLSRRDRSIVTVSALATGGHNAQLGGHWNRALDHGLMPNEAIELVTHLAFQAGWPNAMSALGVAREVFEQRGISFNSISQVTGSSFDINCILPEPIRAMEQTFRKDPFTTALAERLEELVERDVWSRSGLEPRERSISTIEVVVASGNTAQLISEARRGLDSGPTLAELCEIILHLGYYVGLPKARNAARTLNPLGTVAQV